MLTTSKNVLFPGHKTPATTGTDDQQRQCEQVKGHQYRWLAGGYDLEIRYF